MENKGADCGIIVTQKQRGNQDSILRDVETVRASSYEPKSLVNRASFVSEFSPHHSCHPKNSIYRFGLSVLRELG